MDVYAMPFVLAMLVMFVLLCILFIVQLSVSVKEKFSDKYRIAGMAALAGVLILSYLKPGGVINFEKLSGKDLLLAEREGAANCMSYFKIKENNNFIFQQNCFGTSQTKGKYEISGDSIFLREVTKGRDVDSFYKFAVLKPSIFTNGKIEKDIWLYYSENDTSGYMLGITKNFLTK